MAVPVEKIKEAQLNCSICLQTYTDPKQLQCHHVYCQRCLVKLVKQDQQDDQRTLPCPECRQVTPVPDSGVSGLQTAFSTNQLLELVEEHQNKQPISEKVDCPEHDGKEMKLYCEACGEFICYKCTLKGEKHCGHECREFKEEITSLHKPAEKQLTTISEALKQFDACDAEIEHQQELIEATIKDNIEDIKAQLCETLNVRKTELINQLHQLTQTKRESLGVPRKHLETRQSDLRSCLSFLKENFETGIEGVEKLMNTIATVKKLTTTIQPDLLEPKSKADITFSPQAADLLAKCQNYGKLASGSPDPTKCYLAGKGVDTAQVDKNCIAILQVMNFNNEPCTEAASSVTCELISEITGTTTQGSIESKGQSQYEISYMPTIKGRHQLHIKVEGQQIRGSPLLVKVHSPVEMLGNKLIHILGGIKIPHGLAVTKKGEIVITDREEHCFSVCSPSGEKLRSFGTHGSDKGKFHDPFGLALDEEENVIITDCNNGRIQKFTAQGELLTVVGTRGQEPLQFWRPRGIAVNACSGRIYVVDGRNRRIQILNPDLSFYGQFGKEGDGEGEFNKPRHIACDSTGYVYVTDCKNHRIQVFTAEGDFVRIFTTSKWELQEPYGIAIDFSDRVFISERGKSCVSVFTVDGELVKSFGKWGTGSGEFKYPGGLIVDSSGVVYVCDCGNRRVHLY